MLKNQTIVRGSCEDIAAYKWAKSSHDFAGTFSEWMDMPLGNRQQYEDAAAGGCQSKTVVSEYNPYLDNRPILRS